MRLVPKKISEAQIEGAGDRRPGARETTSSLDVLSLSPSNVAPVTLAPGPLPPAPELSSYAHH